MTHLFINALSASAGGGLTYVRNIIPSLRARDDVRVTLFVSKDLQTELAESDRLRIVTPTAASGPFRRFWYEQRVLRKTIQDFAPDVLLTTGNFAIHRSPVPQILLSRNALYLSSDFYRDLRRRGDYRLWIDTRVKASLAKLSILAADRTVAPSQAFAADLQRWTGKQVCAIHHGFNQDTFSQNGAKLPPPIQARLDATTGAVRILFVSHYNYYRNFETLIRAVAIVKQRLLPNAVRLLLTCQLSTKANPGNYQATTAAALVKKLQLDEQVVELGSIQYGALHHLYQACDLYVTPAYAETFAHPLVEAMASGLPVIASELPVHREICRSAAEYFPTFSHQELAKAIFEVAASPGTKMKMRAAGLIRSQDFSWDRHVDQLLQLAQTL